MFAYEEWLYIQLLFLLSLTKRGESRSIHSCSIVLSEVKAGTILFVHILLSFEVACERLGTDRHGQPVTRRFWLFSFAVTMSEWAGIRLFGVVF